jgi:CO dehydrogenase/acetyl-CoA synthase delta subunit
VLSLSLAIVTGCSESKSRVINSTPRSIELLPKDHFKSLLTLEDIQNVSKKNDVTKIQYIDLKKISADIDPNQIESINSWYGTSFEIQNGKERISFSVINFESEISAKKHFEKTTLNPPYVGQNSEVNSTIGDTSLQTNLNAQGIRDVILFVKGNKVVSLSSNQSHENNFAVDIDDLVNLAVIVEHRLME